MCGKKNINPNNMLNLKRFLRSFLLFWLMLTEEAKKDLENQQYRVVGSHSAVKICHWTKSMIRDQGSCYKHTFYGINSHQCLQMTTSISCANRCVFCWRGYKSPVAKEWKWDVDDPKEILEGCIKAHEKLLIGFGGNEKANMKKLEESKIPKHVALSLTGEPIAYPKINEFIKLCNEKKISTFLVTNGQYPEQIKKLEPVTQLYISVDAPNKELMKKIDIPLFEDYWERFEKSLSYMAEKRGRKAIRITLIKEMNDVNVKEYVDLIKKSNTDFIEVKGYMFVGASRQKLSKENMPYHEDIIEFVEKLNGILSDYEIVAEHISSRVVLLAKKEFKKDGKWNTWIDFDKWNNSEDDYNKETPSEYLGISGKGTKDRRKD